MRRPAECRENLKILHESRHNVTRRKTEKYTKKERKKERKKKERKKNTVLNLVSYCLSVIHSFEVGLGVGCTCKVNLIHRVVKVKDVLECAGRRY